MSHRLGASSSLHRGVPPTAPVYQDVRHRATDYLDGHGRQVVWVDPAAVEQGPEAFAASMQDVEAPA